MKQRSESKYQRILQAAMEIFAQKGFHEAKVSEIARCAGVGDGTVYLYFKNKDDLLISLFEATLQQINDDLEAELQRGTAPEDKLKRLVHFHLNLALKDPNLAAFVTMEVRHSSAFMRDYGKSAFNRYLSHWANVIDEGKRSGMFRKELSSGVLKHILFGALDQICITWVNNPNRSKEALDEIGAQLLDLMQYGIMVR